MKKNKLVSSISYDFELIGIVTGVKEYRLAWCINQINDLHFVKQDDIGIEFKDLSRIAISNFTSTSNTSNFSLLKNKLVKTNSQKNQYLLTELQQFDFFLKLESQIDDFDVNQLITSLRNIPIINYLVLLDLEKIKQKENLLY